jgi:hypothetical protein
MADLRELKTTDIPEAIRADVEMLRALCVNDEAAWQAICNVMRALAAQPATVPEAQAGADDETLGEWVERMSQTMGDHNRKMLQQLHKASWNGQFISPKDKSPPRGYNGRGGDGGGAKRWVDNDALVDGPPGSTTTGGGDQ